MKNKTYGYIKRFTKKKWEECFQIHATTWDGKEKVLVVTPKKPTENQRKATIEFLLHELDDHSGVDEYLELLKNQKEVK